MAGEREALAAYLGDRALPQDIRDAVSAALGGEDPAEIARLGPSVLTPLLIAASFQAATSLPGYVARAVGEAAIDPIIKCLEQPGYVLGADVATAFARIFERAGSRKDGAERSARTAASRFLSNGLDAITETLHHGSDGDAVFSWRSWSDSERVAQHYRRTECNFAGGHPKGHTTYVTEAAGLLAFHLYRCITCLPAREAAGQGVSQ